MATPTVLEKIDAEILATGKDDRYPLEAYRFILDGLNFYYAVTGEKRHFSGRELAKGFCDFAATQFGPLACRVLNSWGIRTTDDFGYLVYNLIDISLISKNENDALEDFFGILDIQHYIETLDHYPIDRAHIKSIKGA